MQGHSSSLSSPKGSFPLLQGTGTNIISCQRHRQQKAQPYHVILFQEHHSASGAQTGEVGEQEIELPPPVVLCCCELCLSVMTILVRLPNASLGKAERRYVSSPCCSGTTPEQQRQGTETPEQKDQVQPGVYVSHSSQPCFGDSLENLSPGMCPGGAGSSTGRTAAEPVQGSNPQLKCNSMSLKKLFSPFLAYCSSATESN